MNHRRKRATELNASTLSVRSAGCSVFRSSYAARARLIHKTQSKPTTSTASRLIDLCTGCIRHYIFAKPIVATTARTKDGDDKKAVFLSASPLRKRV